MKQITILTKHVCALAVLLACAVTATAADFEVDDISYNVIGEHEVEVTKRDSVKYEGEVIIPATVINDGVVYRVTRIGVAAFTSCYDLMQVELPEGVTEIGSNAFSSCRNLESIDLPNSVESIGEYAFAYCYAMTNFYFPRNVSHVDQFTFYRSPNITAFMCSGSNPYMKTVNGVLYSRDMTRLMLYPPAAAATTFDIPETVTRIEAGAFYSSANLTQVNFPESVTWMGPSAMRNCDNLVSLYLPDGIQHIGPACFYDCDKLSDLHLPAALDTICNGIGSNCLALGELVIPRNVKYIDDYAFIDATGLTGIIFEEGSCLEAIGTRSFDGTSLVSVDLPSSLKKIGGQVFGNCAMLKHAHLGDNLTEMGGATFWNCPSIVEGEIPGTVVSIKNAFVRCPALKRVKFGDRNSVPGTTFVRNCGLSSCENVEYLELGANIDTLEYLAFSGVGNLKVVVNWATTPPKFRENGSSAFNPYPRYLDATLYVPLASLETYSSAYDWKDFPVIAAIEYVGDLNFNGGLDVTDITTLINMLLNNDIGDLAPYADVNLDGSVNVTDLTTLINLVLNAR